MLLSCIRLARQKDWKAILCPGVWWHSKIFLKACMRCDPNSGFKVWREWDWCYESGNLCSSYKEGQFMFLDCPVCMCSASLMVPFVKIRGSRTRCRDPLYYCMECDSFYQRPNYAESDSTLRGDLQWHVRKASFYSEHIRRILGKIISQHPTAKTMLDIGCGIGVSVREGARLGLSAQGIEINRYAVEYAASMYSTKLIQGPFAANLFSQKFDVILLDNVLEHIAEPSLFIKEVFAVLNSGGVLYLAVPNRRGGLLRIIYSILFPTVRYSVFTDNDVHINHFARKGILKLIQPYGAKIISEVYSGVYIIRGR